MIKDEDGWKELAKKAAELKFDGCTGVADFHLPCCYHHDLMYRTGKDIYGTEVSRKEADYEFMLCIQSRSRLGKFSPMAFVRWVGVRLLASRAWKGK